MSDLTRSGNDGVEVAVAWETMAAFWAVSLLFVITPGADWAYAISAGLRHRSVMPSVAGLLSGHLVATGVVAAGVATFMAGSPAVMTALTVAGAAYLVWLGVGSLTGPVPSAAPAAAPRSARPAAVLVGANALNAERAASADLHRRPPGGEVSWWRQVVKGAGVSGLNPKVFLLFLALLPQFTDPESPWPVAGQIAGLGLVHVASCAVVYTAVGTSTRAVLRARPGAAALVTRVSGAAMVVVGVLLLVERLVSHG